MKKLLIAVAVVLASLGGARADETNSKIWFDFGAVNVYIPFRSVSAVALWDGVDKKVLAGAETPLASWKRFVVVGGAVTSVEPDGAGTPFLGVHISIPNPAENYVALASFNPGIFAGRNFRSNEWVLGLKASVGLF